MCEHVDEYGNETLVPIEGSGNAAKYRRLDNDETVTRNIGRFRCTQCLGGVVRSYVPTPALVRSHP